MNKPYSESCDQNRDPIFDIIQPLLANKKHLLEIGSGTGQHAVYFAKKLPHLTWQCSDQQEYHQGINQWLDEAKLDNTPAPMALNVSDDKWPSAYFDAIFSANSVHIMSWQNVIDFINNIGKITSSGSILILYGPFNYNGQYTSESNARFDTWLKERNPDSGIRDYEAVNALAEQAGFSLKEDYAMPANNRILAWVKRQNH